MTRALIALFIAAVLSPTFANLAEAGCTTRCYEFGGSVTCNTDCY